MNDGKSNLGDAEQKREGRSSTAALVERLRERAANPTRALKFNDGQTITISSSPPRDALLDEAADEISRLRAVNADMLAALQSVHVVLLEAIQHANSAAQMAGVLTLINEIKTAITKAAAPGEQEPQR